MSSEKPNTIATQMADGVSYTTDTPGVPQGFEHGIYNALALVTANGLYHMMSEVDSPLGFPGMMATFGSEPIAQASRSTIATYGRATGQTMEEFAKSVESAILDALKPFGDAIAAACPGDTLVEQAAYLSEHFGHRTVSEESEPEESEDSE